METLRNTKEPASDDADRLRVDAVVVGSGAGGGMMAAELVQAGLTVLVLEKGGMFDEADFNRWHEPEGSSFALRSLLIG